MNPHPELTATGGANGYFAESVSSAHTRRDPVALPIGGRCAETGRRIPECSCSDCTARLYRIGGAR